MKKLAAALLVVLVAGCSGMGMRSSGSGMSSSSGGMGMSRTGMDNQSPGQNSQVVDPATGRLNPYHGG